MNTLDYVDVFMHAKEGGAAPGSGVLLIPHWTAGEWQKLFSRTTPQPFRASEVVIKQGDLDRSLFFVASGMLDVAVTSPGGVEQLARVGPGSVLGEQAFFDGQPRSANVTGVTDGVLLHIGFKDYEKFGKEEQAQSRDLLNALARVLSTRLRSVSSRIRH
jgi:CRP-like cAMP-binding protein